MKLEYMQRIRSALSIGQTVCESLMVVALFYVAARSEDGTFAIAGAIAFAVSEMRDAKKKQVVVNIVDGKVKP